MLKALESVTDSFRDYKKMLTCVNNKLRGRNNLTMHSLQRLAADDLMTFGKGGKMQLTSLGIKEVQFWARVLDSSFLTSEEEKCLSSYRKYQG